MRLVIKTGGWRVIKNGLATMDGKIVILYQKTRPEHLEGITTRLNPDSLESFYEPALTSSMMRPIKDSLLTTHVKEHILFRPKCSVKIVSITEAEKTTIVLQPDNNQDPAQPRLVLWGLACDKCIGLPQTSGVTVLGTTKYQHNSVERMEFVLQMDKDSVFCVKATHKKRVQYHTVMNREWLIHNSFPTPERLKEHLITIRIRGFRGHNRLINNRAGESTFPSELDYDGSRATFSNPALS